MKSLVETIILFAFLLCPFAGSGKDAPSVTYASAIGFNPQDSTAILQKAIDSGTAKVIIDKVDGVWYTAPLKLRSNLELVIADGVTVQALPGAYKNESETMFSARKVKNLIIRGEGKSRLIMNKNDYQDSSRYRKSEWRHLLALYSCRNVVIRDMELTGSGGDGIYLGSASDLTPNRNILIDNVICRDHHRQGISIISADNLTIRNSRFCHTSGTAPACGLDIEPNDPREIIRNVLIENCSFDHNDNCGIMICFRNSQNASNVTVRNCRSFNNEVCGLSVYTFPEMQTAGGSLQIKKCCFYANKDSAMILNNQFNGGIRIIFDDCIMDNRHSKSPEVLIFNNSQLPADAGNVLFSKTTWYSDERERIIRFIGSQGKKISGISGVVRVIPADKRDWVINWQQFSRLAK